MRSFFAVLAIGFLLWGGSPARALEDAIPESPEEILADAFGQYFSTGYSVVSFTNIDTTRDEDDPKRERLMGRIGTWLLEEDPGQYCVYGEFVAPASKRGQRFLVKERPRDEVDQPRANDYWITLGFSGSAMKRRRISGSQRKDEFHATTLSQGDVEFRRGNDWDPERIENEMFEGEKVYVFYVRPRFNGGYEEAEIIVATDDRAILRIIQFEVNGNTRTPMREIYIGRDNVITQDGVSIPKMLIVRDLAGRSHLMTRVVWEERDVGRKPKQRTCVESSLEFSSRLP